MLALPSTTSSNHHHTVCPHIRGPSTNQYLAIAAQLRQTNTLQDTDVFLLVGVRQALVGSVEGEGVGVMRSATWTQLSQSPCHLLSLITHPFRAGSVSANLEKGALALFSPVARHVHNQCRQYQCTLGEECNDIVVV